MNKNDYRKLIQKVAQKIHNEYMARFVPKSEIRWTNEGMDYPFNIELNAGTVVHGGAAQMASGYEEDLEFLGQGNTKQEALQDLINNIEDAGLVFSQAMKHAMQLALSQKNNI